MRARAALFPILLTLLAVPPAEAAFERHEIRAADGSPVAVVVFDSEKAITRGSERGFFVLVENPDATANTTVRLVALAPNGTALELVASPNATVEPLGIAEMTVLMRAGRDAALGRHALDLVVTATRGTNATSARFSIMIEISDLPTPFGETVDTLSPWERATLSMGLLGLAGGAIAGGFLRRLRRPRR